MSGYDVYKNYLIRKKEIKFCSQIDKMARVTNETGYFNGGYAPSNPPDLSDFKISRISKLMKKLMQR